MNFLNSYLNSFKGLSREIWFLALVTFVNRAGTMVVPFLSLYLTDDKGFELADVGWIMSAFGLGSVVGAWIGGKLSARMGFYKLMVGSLLISGVLFVLLQFLDSFYSICGGVFVLMIAADSFRPAAFVAISSYSEAENRTRSISLYRLAINLGFSLGPAAGGFIVATIGYRGLFWADGLTCIFAAFIFMLLLSPVASRNQLAETKKQGGSSPYRDLPYLLLVFITFLIGFAFLQCFSTIPLYYKQVHFLNEEEIGLLMALNGLLIFVVEMPLVKYLDRPVFSIYRVITFSLILLMGSFLVLNFFSWVGILTIGMLLLTFGEILNFPFINSLALVRSERGNMGEYMALFTIAFSLAHILAHKTGMYLIATFGYEITWYFMSGVLLFALVLLLWLKQILRKEKESEIRQT